jgi:hypothetical protein
MFSRKKKLLFLENMIVPYEKKKTLNSFSLGT